VPTLSPPTTASEALAARGGPQAGGTTWRVWGLDFDGIATGIGVETFADHLGRRVLLITLLGGSKP
jgi:hypothetical protein